MLIAKLFPWDSDFESETEKQKYLTSIYNCFPNLKIKLKYKNYIEKELVIVKLMLDFSTIFLKQYDGPYFKRYKYDLIQVWIWFYKMMYKLDQETEGESEWKLYKTIKKQIVKALTKIDVSKAQIKEMKTQMFISSKSKQMIKFYKTEYKLYEDDVFLMDKEKIYI